MPDRPTLDPQRTALLVMDYRNGIVAQLADTDPLLDRVTTAVDDVRAHGGRIGWVRVAFDDADFEAIPETSIFAAMTSGARRTSMHVDAPATRIHDRLEPRPDDIAVRKTRVGAFSTTDLDRQLRAHDITTLVLAGLSTSGVVLSTVREATDRDYHIVVLHDACADRDPATHRFLTDTLFPAHTHVTSVGELDALWARGWPFVAGLLRGPRRAGEQLTRKRREPEQRALRRSATRASDTTSRSPTWPGPYQTADQGRIALRSSRGSRAWSRDGSLGARGGQTTGRAAA